MPLALSCDAMQTARHPSMILVCVVHFRNIPGIGICPDSWQTTVTSVLGLLSNLPLWESKLLYCEEGYDESYRISNWALQPGVRKLAPNQMHDVKMTTCMSLQLASVITVMAQQVKPMSPMLAYHMGAVLSASCPTYDPAPC